MAKSKSFFGLRTGSTKSLTFQVFRGQQITKDRVYRVSNPRTQAQMTQRALIPIVAAARASLKGLVDHSFEGIQYGEASLREFSKMNLRAGAIKVTSYSPNGVSNPGFANLIVSNGTLSGDYEFTDSKDTKNIFSSNKSYPLFKFPAANADIPASTIFSYLETYGKENNVPLLKPGTQLTFLSICQAGSVNIKTATGTTEASLSSFVIDRIMIPNSETSNAQMLDVNGQWKVKSQVAEGAKSVVIVNNNGDEITIFSTGAEQSSTIGISIAPKAAANNTNCGGALILSRYENGTWRRSPSQLNIGYEPEHIYTFEDWLSVYQTTGAASKKYLNNGDESTGIQG